jgi:co-chaperonin GroES (HSP10)
MKATKNHIIIEVLPAEEKTAGGLFLADESKKQVLGKVLSVCDNWLELDSEPLYVGDIILFDEKAGQDFGDFRILEHKDIYLTI